MKRAITAIIVSSGLLVGTAAAAVPASAATKQAFTRAQVAQHSSTGDCWIIIGRGVYDVTAYLPRHPGGPGQISPYCGSSASQAFAGQHRGDRQAKQQLAPLKIGRVKR